MLCVLLGLEAGAAVAWLETNDAIANGKAKTSFEREGRMLELLNVPGGMDSTPA